MLVGLGYLVGALLVLAAVGVVLAWRQMGEHPSGARLERIERSSNYGDSRFQNSSPVPSYTLTSFWEMAKDYWGDQQRTPDEPPPVEQRAASDYAEPPESGLRVTWLGHSSALIEIDGHRILLDPIFSQRLSPLSFVGPERFFPAPVGIDDLPQIHAVVISHDHYDHLDRASVTALASRVERFVVPLGVGSHLEYWGIAADQIVELDWWEETKLGESLRLVACPARHFSGRSGLGDKTLWAGFALVGPEHRVYFSGDSGLTPGFQEAGDRFGPFDLTLLEMAAYGRSWPDVHMVPEQAIEAHRMLRGKLLMPIHWGTLNLAYHGWTEPAERLIVAADEGGIDIVIPKPGVMFDPAKPPPVERWWPSTPWEDAAGQQMAAAAR